MVLLSIHGSMVMAGSSCISVADWRTGEMVFGYNWSYATSAKKSGSGVHERDAGGT